MISVELLKALPGFTLDAQWSAGDGVVALFGPSGAGKSLTLHCLAGLIRPDGGRVNVRGRVLFDGVRGINQPSRDRRLGVVFQGYALFPHLTVAENVAYGLERRPRRERLRRTEEILTRLDLLAVAGHRPGQLAGGQQQRVALGRALAPDPDLLLLDEPLAALEAPLRRQLREELAGLLRGFGKTAVVVTHDLAEACQLADEIVVYERGRVVQAGLKEELLARPASPAVASALGARNLLRGTLLDRGPGTLRLGWRGHALTVTPAFGATELPVGGTVWFAIRPEHVRLMRKDRPGPAAARRLNLISGRIVSELDQGATTTLRFRADGEGTPAQGEYDLEIELGRLVYRLLGVAYDRSWTISIQPNAIQLLPDPEPSAAAHSPP